MARRVSGRVGAGRARDAGAGGRARGRPGPSWGEQFGDTRRAARALLGAHLALLRAELTEIAAQLRIIAAYAAVVLVLGIVLANLVVIGGALFLGETLFGSLGWGVLHGTLLLVGTITALALALVGAPARVTAGSLTLAIVVGAALAVILGSNVTSALIRRAVVAMPTLDPARAPLVVALLGGALVLGLIGLLAGARSAGGRGALAGLVVGAVLGLLVGALLGARIEWHVAAAIGVTVALVLWPLLQVAGARRAGVDPRRRFERLRPRESVEAARETKEWVMDEWAKRRAKLGRR